VEEFAPTAPRLPPHYGVCSYMKGYEDDLNKDPPNQE